MPFLYPKGKIIFFAHVPKTAGSSVKDYLIRRFGPMSLGGSKMHDGGLGTGFLSPVDHLSARDLQEVLPPHLDFCFGIVRDPLRRAISEYRWQKQRSLASRLDFSTWLRVVIAAARLDPRVYGNHIRPQDQMVPSSAEVFRLEDGFDALVARLDAVAGKTAPDLSIGRFGQRAAVPEVRYWRQDAALITEYYAADYARFGYDSPDIEALEPDPRAGLRGLVAWPLARMLVAKQHRDWVRWREAA